MKSIAELEKEIKELEDLEIQPEEVEEMIDTLADVKFQTQEIITLIEELKQTLKDEIEFKKMSIDLRDYNNRQIFYEFVIDKKVNELIKKLKGK